ncbi:hypothetical protein CSC17_5660 [Klebsiella oxytoca]|nr:hypothetical protein CSC17_5660 [Klebsiella oxytoca]EUC83719.1 hypothetical protein HMPREF1570_5069 [Klebsiella oxytoca KA-2]
MAIEGMTFSSTLICACGPENGAARRNDNQNITALSREKSCTFNL